MKDVNVWPETAFLKKVKNVMSTAFNKRIINVKIQLNLSSINVHIVTAPMSNSRSLAEFSNKISFHMFHKINYFWTY